MFYRFGFFKTSLKVNHHLTYELMLSLSKRYKNRKRKCEILPPMPVKGRVTNALIRLNNKFGVTDTGFVDITITKQDIRSFAGTTYETVFRIINEFIEDNAIKVLGKNFGILNQSILEKSMVA